MTNTKKLDRKKAEQHAEIQLIPQMLKPSCSPRNACATKRAMMPVPRYACASLKPGSSSKKRLNIPCVSRRTSPRRPVVTWGLQHTNHNLILRNYIKWPQLRAIPSTKKLPTALGTKLMNQTIITFLHFTSAMWTKIEK
jgi:hypothetical protein